MPCPSLSSQSSSNLSARLSDGEHATTKLHCSGTPETIGFGDDVVPHPSLREECGVMGVLGHATASQLAYFGLYALQHRGQESCGIVVGSSEPTEFNPKAASSGGPQSPPEHTPLHTPAHSAKVELRVHKNFGLVSDVFSRGKLDSLTGDTALGHVRYATSESGRRENIQPFVFSIADHGPMALAHNGNITNATILKKHLESKGCVFTTTSDTEVVVHLMAQSQKTTIADKIKDATLQLKGGFVLVFLGHGELYALRDRHGLRPLVLGSLGSSQEPTIIASETCALDLIDATYIREVMPGEMIHLSLNPDLKQDSKPGHDHKRYRAQYEKILPPAAMAFCSFEPIYFSRPDSWCGGESVYDIRKRIGAVLARQYPVTADCVIAVPDSAMPVAIGYAAEAGLPLELGMIRNHYVGRTFIEPSQAARDLGVKLKLNATRSVLEGKECVIVDDSIVRGTTSLKIVKMLRKAGAAKIHFRVGSPPVTHSCHYGISTPNRRKLLAAQVDVHEIRRRLDVDTLGYLTREGLAEALGGVEHNNSHPDNPRLSYCMACFNGPYPVHIDHPLAYETHPTDHQGCGFYSSR